jgi:hypothetical protein
LALPVWTTLLGGGHVLPFLLLVPALAAGSMATIATSVLACAIVYGTRATLVFRFRQSWLGALLHPVGITLLLILQWSALVGSLRGRPAVWRGRAYSS